VKIPETLGRYPFSSCAACSPRSLSEWLGQTAQLRFRRQPSPDQLGHGPTLRRQKAHPLPRTRLDGNAGLTGPAGRSLSDGSIQTAQRPLLFVGFFALALTNYLLTHYKARE
jgi:hypothetical protein